MKKEEEKSGRLEVAGAADRCEPACKAGRRPVKSSTSPTSETLMRKHSTHSTHSKRATRAEPRDLLAICFGLQLSGPHKQRGRTSEPLSEPLLRYRVPRSPSTLAPLPLDHHRLSHPPVHHGRLVGPANLAAGTPNRPRTLVPAHLPANHHRLALSAPIPRPAARKVQSTVAVLAIPARPRQRRPMRSAAAVW